MQKWEYLEIRRDGYNWMYDTENRWRKGFGSAVLNDLGREGWELTGVLVSDYGGYICELFFKGPKQ